jgi:hypothetical protein
MIRKQGKRSRGILLCLYSRQTVGLRGGHVDGRAAMIVYDREVSLETPAYFVAIDFDGDRVVSVHDFLYARYAMNGIDCSCSIPNCGLGKVSA